MKFRLAPLLLGLGFGLMAGNAAADAVNDKMRQMFGGNYNSTMPGAVSGATRGVITGGGISIRQPIKTRPHWSFDPPSISAGCGGIDLYGGNLSFPDKEQYIQMGRAIIGNIGGAAFKMALSQTCSLCDAVMSDIQDTVQALNFDNMSSCQIANQMVDVAANKENPFGFAAEAGRNVAAEASFSRSRDWFESYNAGPGKESPVVAALSDPAVEGVLQGNLIWNALEETEAADWLGESKKVREEVMSIIGTIVTCSASGDDDKCPMSSENGDIGMHTFYPELTLAEYATLEADASDSYSIYSCSDEPCLNPKPTDRAFGKTVAQLIVDTYLGADGQPGLLARSVMPGDIMRDGMTELEAIMLARTNTVGARAFACARSGDIGMGYARLIIEGMAPQIAAETLHTGLKQTIAKLRAHIGRKAVVVGAGPATDLLVQASDTLDKQLADIRSKTQGNDMLASAIDRCSQTAVAASVVGGW